MTKRAGVTEKVSVSVNKDDLVMLKKRAKRLHGGNVSAVFADLIAEIRRREAWDRAVAWYGAPIVLNDEEKDAIDRELLGGGPSKRARRKRMA